MSGSGEEFRIKNLELRNWEEIIIEKQATNIPYKICLEELFGVVIGSGNITKEKNKTVGSTNVKLLLKIKFKSTYVARNVKIILARLTLTKEI